MRLSTTPIGGIKLSPLSRSALLDTTGARQTQPRIRLYSTSVLNTADSTPEVPSANNTFQMHAFSLPAHKNGVRTLTLSVHQNNNETISPTHSHSTSTQSLINLLTSESHRFRTSAPFSSQVPITGKKELDSNILRTKERSQLTPFSFTKHSSQQYFYLYSNNKLHFLSLIRPRFTIRRNGPGSLRDLPHRTPNHRRSRRHSLFHVTILIIIITSRRRILEKSHV